MRPPNSLCPPTVHAHAAHSLLHAAGTDAHRHMHSPILLAPIMCTGLCARPPRPTTSLPPSRCSPASLHRPANLPAPTCSAATEATARGAAGWFRDPTASGSSIVVGKSGASLLASVHSMDSVSPGLFVGGQVLCAWRARCGVVPAASLSVHEPVQEKRTGSSGRWCGWAGLCFQLCGLTRFLGRVSCSRAH